jgi:competence protein ComEA
MGWGVAAAALLLMGATSETSTMPAAAQVQPVDLNAATAAQLTAIKGLTPDLAAKIIAARPFRSLDELSKVGMSKAQIDAVRPYLTIGGPRRKGRWRKPAYTLAPGEKVDINAAERKVLEALPYIGVARAIAIIESRPFARIEDLMKVKGIKQKTFARIRHLVVVR